MLVAHARARVAQEVPVLLRDFGARTALRSLCWYPSGRLRGCDTDRDRASGPKLTRFRR
jgi:hypothetical protein